MTFSEINPVEFIATQDIVANQPTTITWAAPEQVLVRYIWVRDSSGNTLFDLEWNVTQGNPLQSITLAPIADAYTKAQIYMLGNRLNTEIPQNVLTTLIRQ